VLFGYSEAMSVSSGAGTIGHGTAHAPPPLSEVAGLRAGVVPPTSKLLPAPLSVSITKKAIGMWPPLETA
jgi:hypothetical protein